MAHIGKTYELAFRRDLSVGVLNNRQGWAKHYFIKFQNCFGSVATPANGILWVASPTFDQATGSMSGESQHQVAGGVTGFARMQAHIHLLPQVYELTISFWKEPMTKLFEQKIGDFFTWNYEDLGHQGDDPSVFQTPGVFEMVPNSLASNFIFAKHWHD